MENRYLSRNIDTALLNRALEGKDDGPGSEGPGGLEFLSEEGDSTAAAANLFAALHRLDKLALRCIHAERAPGGTLGEAINDRLGRAAAEKA